MVQRINHVTDICWFHKDNRLSIKNLAYNLPFTLPALFIELLKISNGGSVDYDFSYYDSYFKEIIETAIGLIYGIEPSEAEDITKEYYNPPEFFPKDLVAFGETGNGDRVCFDYRNDPKTDNPPIVYWNHEADIGGDVSFVANNFEEFVSMLREPENEDDEI